MSQRILAIQVFTEYFLQLVFLVPSRAELIVRNNHRMNLCHSVNSMVAEWSRKVT